MNLLKRAQAGTFESSDIFVLIEPVEKGKGRSIELSSNVILQFEENIKSTIHEVLDRFEIADLHLIAKDKGALDHTIKARVETAVLRALGQEKGTLQE